MMSESQASDLMVFDSEAMQMSSTEQAKQTFPTNPGDQLNIWGSLLLLPWQPLSLVFAWLK